MKMKKTILLLIVALAFSAFGEVAIAQTKPKTSPTIPNKATPRPFTSKQRVKRTKPSENKEAESKPTNTANPSPTPTSIANPKPSNVVSPKERNSQRVEQTIDPKTMKARRELTDFEKGAENNPRTVFERALDSLPNVKFLNYSNDGSYSAFPMKLDSIEAIRLTFPQIMFNRVLFVTLKPTNTVSPGLWVDLNNNDIREPNEVIDTPNKMLAIKVNDNVITFYGKIDSLKTYFYPTLPKEVKQVILRKGQEKFVCDRISTIDISWSTQLKHLDLSGSNLEKIVFGDNEELRSVNLDNNRLHQLEVFDLTNLERIFCRNNNIKMIDVRGCENLSVLNCANNQLKTLKFESLDKLSTFNFANNQLENIDLSKFPALTRVDCSKNGLKTLSIPNGKLSYLSCSENLITLLDLSEANSLTSLFCHKNALYKIIFPKKSKLELVSCHENQLNSLELNTLTNLKTLDCSKNKLTNLDLTANKNIENLNASANKLLSLRANQASKLTKLNIAFNDLTDLQLSNFKNIKVLDCSNNHISSINLSNSTELEELNVSHNALSSLNIDRGSKIKSLSCYSNSITADNLALLLANLSATKRSDTADIYLMNNNPIKERNNIAASEDIMKKMANWRIFYVEIDNDTLINVNTVDYPHFDNVHLINLSPARNRSKAFKLKINGVAPPFNVAITDANMNIITQYESGASFVDIKSLKNGVYNVRIAKEGKADFYNFIKN